MSTLIDDLINVYKPGNCTYRRVRDAYRILIGKSRAYHYWEDENE